jgi:hypothetical protein
MHMLAALDLATGKIYYRIRACKRHREFADLLTSLRTRWPGEKLHVVCDNFSPHLPLVVGEHELTIRPLRNRHLRMPAISTTDSGATHWLIGSTVSGDANHLCRRPSWPVYRAELGVEISAALPF